MAAEQAETKRDFRPGDIVKHFKREMLLMMFRSSNRERRKIENKLKEAEHKKCLSERQ